MSKNQSFAWGGNNYGQLGYPSYNVNFVEISNIDDVTESAGGYSHSLALKQDGTVWAWGHNYDGQLGDGTNNNSNEPVQVKGLTNIKAIAAGYYHSLAIKDDGTVWAWGYNSNGQLGDGTTDNSNEPVQVKGLKNVKSVAAGQYHSLAIQEGETEEYAIAWAWGSNWDGQLGNETIEGSTGVPVQVKNLTNVKSVAAGNEHSLAIEEDGTAWAWGSNRYGQLGSGTTEEYTGTPVQVVNLKNVKSVAAGNEHSLAIEEGGIAWAWGNNWSGQLGNGKTGGDYATPEQVKNLENVIDISAGRDHSLVVNEDGTAWAWGDNQYGQLGNGTTDNSNEPVQVSSLTNAKLVAGGGNYSLTVKNDGTMWSWGNNHEGQLGIGHFGGFSSSPVLISSINNIQDIAAGNSFNLALKNDKKVRSWGINWYGQLGDGTRGGSIYTPVEVVLADVKGISAGCYHGLAIKSDGTAWAWGSNQYGQLGNGTTDNSNEPVQVSSLTNVIDISGGNEHSLALKNDGTVWAWGDNESGQLGNGTTGGNSSTPQQVMNLTDVIAIAAGYYHSLAIKNDGTVWTWGSNWGGQLGNGITGGPISTPVQVVNLTNVISISGGDSHSLAIKSDGTAWTWGSNNHGQLGDGTEENRDKPVQVSDLTNVTGISGGGNHSLAIKSDGTAWAWGSNNYGQLGDETNENRNEPVKVSDITNIQSIAAGDNHSLALRVIRVTSATRGIPFM